MTLPLILVPSASGQVLEAKQERLAGRLQEVRIPFLANSGQIDPAVAYYAPTFAGTVFVTREGRIVYSLPKARASGSGARPGEEASGWSLTETVVGGRARPTGSEPASTGVSYFIGNDPARWRSGLATFEVVSLGEVWPGIRLELRAHGKNVEKFFTLQPGADASRIGIRIAGSSWLRVNEAGALVAGTGFGEVTFAPPAAYQERHGVRHPVRVAYELCDREYGFRLADHDSTLPVLIDPLLQATYLGGGSGDEARALAIHPTSGDVYVAGRTTSTNFPGTSGGAQAISGGSQDAFVARLNAALTTLIQATYLGGSGFFDEAHALAIHPTSGDVYVAGFTDSTNFPGTAGGAQAVSGGSQDAFVARLNAALTTLIQATYLGGSDGDDADALAIHPNSGDVYVAGRTTSTNFPGTSGGAQAVKGGFTDAFAVRLNAALTTLTQATYLGGSSHDFANALAIHQTSGDVYVGGLTESTDFPGTSGGAQPANAGNDDAFVARLNAALTTLARATYLGGSGFEGTYALAIHPNSGEVYAAGFTDSTNFPGTAGGAQGAYGGQDAFVARLNAALTALAQATYLGGTRQDFPYALAIHPASGDVYVAGLTTSTNFPGTAGGAQAANGGSTDAFVVSLNAALTMRNQATYLGGSSADEAHALAIHPTSGNVYVGGFTESTDFPSTAAGAQAANGGTIDAFVARLTAGLEGVPTPTPTNTPTNTPTSTPTSTPTTTPTDTPTSTPTNTPTPVPVVPMLNGRAMLIFGLLVAGVGLLLLTRWR